MKLVVWIDSRLKIGRDSPKDARGLLYALAQAKIKKYMRDYHANHANQTKSDFRYFGIITNHPKPVECYRYNRNTNKI